MTTEMGRGKKFGFRIRKMKPEPMTITRTKRLAWGKTEKQQETVLGTLLFSLICIQCSCIHRRANLEDDDIPTTDQHQGQVEAGSDRIPARMNYRSSTPTPSYSGDDESVRPNLIQVLEAVGVRQPFGPHERQTCMFPSMPGAVGEFDQSPPNFLINGSAAAAAGALSSLPYAVHAQPPARSSAYISENGYDSDDDFEVTILPSREGSRSNSSDEQQKVNDKKQAEKKSKKKGKSGKKKKSSKTENAPGSKIPTLKEWAKKEEKKRKAEKEREKKQLKKEKKQQKQQEKTAAKLEKQKKVQRKKEEKEAAKAEKEAAKAEKAAAKAEKAADKAKKAADKAEAKKKEKQSKLALRLQKELDDSDRQMAADLEKQQVMLKEQKRKQEDKARRKMEDIARTEQIIKTLQEKLEQKEKRVGQLCDRRDGRGRDSILVAFKLQYKITDYNRRISSLKSVIAKLKKRVEAKRNEVEKLAPHLLETGMSADIQDAARPYSSSSGCDESDVSDDDNILDMLSYFDSDSESSDEEIEEEEVAPGRCSHSNVQETLRKAQESLQKMDDAGATRRCYNKQDEPSYLGKGKGPANGRKTVKKCL